MYMNSIIRTLKLSLVMAIFAFAASCSSSRHTSVSVSSGTAGKTNLPPGQAKKVNGDQSAKEYAPGHQKKQKGGTTVIVKNK